jgi:hypothetical protein
VVKTVATATIERCAEGNDSRPPRSERSWGILARRFLREGDDGGAEKKLPLAQEPLPGSSCAGGFCYVETGLTDALRSSLIHNFSKAQSIL